MLHFQVEMKILKEDDEIEQVVVDPYHVLETWQHEIGQDDRLAFDLKKTAYDRLLFPESQ